MVEKILDCMDVAPENREVQRIQTEHRLRLIKHWGISKGNRILEIGCGQGDTTAVLAYFVGEKGFVHGIDIASGDYGTPLTLEQSQNKILASEIGSRIKINFNTDITSDSNCFENEPYDYAVLSHCSWYFSSEEQLLKVLEKARKLAKRLCFAEWDIRPQFPNQIAHFYAASIQALCESFNDISTSNIRTLFSPYDIARIAKEAGWSITYEASIDSCDMQDGRWEVNMTLSKYPAAINSSLSIPPRMKNLLISQLEILEKMKKNEIKALNTYVIAAE